MTPEIRRRIHAFRNALVLAADIRSNECFWMDRWQELNEFPHGCCDLASNFLAQYLQDSDPTLNPVIVHMQTTQSFQDKEISSIEYHVIVELEGWLIDLTLNQFAEYRRRVVIEKNTGNLGNLIREITVHGGDVTTRGIQLDAGLNQDGQELYDWLKATADSLLCSGGQAA